MKPAGYDPKKRYPLLCVIHGGPTGIDRPVWSTRASILSISGRRAARSLRVNYRGSAGYWPAVPAANVNNLGVGDAWDVLSGIDALIAQEHVSPNKLACMGWSQGVHFRLHSRPRRPASRPFRSGPEFPTGRPYTDITPFAAKSQCESGGRSEDLREDLTVSYVKAVTPTLVQHSELDRRVPIASAYELRQALEDRGVPVEMGGL